MATDLGPPSVVPTSVHQLDDGAWISVNDERQVTVSQLWLLARHDFCDCDLADFLTEWVAMRIAADGVPGYIADLVETYTAEREEGQSFREFIAAHDEEELQELAEPAETDYADPYMHNTKMTWYPYAVVFR